MDLKTLETTSSLAIEAVYKSFWDLIPEKYKLKEKAQRDFEKDERLSQDARLQKVKPLSYTDVEKKDFNKVDEYEIYCSSLSHSDRYFDLQPFFDPQLDFENRLHYKLAGIGYPDRYKTWFIITWNCGSGILKSTLTNRLLDTTTIETPTGEKVVCDFINTEMDVTLCFNSNNLQALLELQEVIRVSQREKQVIYTRLHSILGEIAVSLDLIETGNIAKASRDKSTLCTLTTTIHIDYPVIGNIRPEGGIIKTIHAEYDRENGLGPDNHEVLARDIIS